MIAKAGSTLPILSLATIQQALRKHRAKSWEYHDYTVYLQPNLYTVKKGHKLALVFNTYDPSDLTVEHPYGSDLQDRLYPGGDSNCRKTRAQKASYLPSASDTDYTNLPEVEGAALVAPEVHYKGKNIPFQPQNTLSNQAKIFLRRSLR